MARHWNQHHDKDVSSLVIWGMEKITKLPRKGDSFRTLCKKEVFWIFHLNTRKPAGLNFEWDVSHFYEWYRFLGPPKMATIIYQLWCIFYDRWFVSLLSWLFFPCITSNIFGLDGYKFSRRIPHSILINIFFPLASCLVFVFIWNWFRFYLCIYPFTHVCLHPVFSLAGVA